MLKIIKLLFKKYFAAGLLVLVPLVGTVWILRSLVLWIDELFLSFVPHALWPFAGVIPGVGFVITIVIVLFVGVLTRNYLGKRLIAVGDRIISKIPFGRSIYGALKQIMHTAFTQNGKKFQGVCIVEYPKESSYALAFITGECDELTSPTKDSEYLRVFVPTTPNPTSGFMLFLPRKKIRQIDMSVEEASKLIISGGLLGP